jgi:ribosome-associated protein
MKAPADSSPAAQAPVPVVVDPPITLGQFLKLAGLADTGGDAKYIVAAGLVTVNGQVERRRGHRLGLGDIVEIQGASVQAVTAEGAQGRRGRATGPRGLEGSQARE